MDLSLHVGADTIKPVRAVRAVRDLGVVIVVRYSYSLLYEYAVYAACRPTVA